MAGDHVRHDGRGRARSFVDAAVLVADGTILAVGRPGRGRPGATPACPSSAAPGAVVTPGFVNAHQHLTGDRLIRSSIPDDLPAGRVDLPWAVPDPRRAHRRRRRAVGHARLRRGGHPRRHDDDRGRHRGPSGPGRGRHGHGRHAGHGRDVGLGRRRRPVRRAGRRGAGAPGRRARRVPAGRPGDRLGDPRRARPDVRRARRAAPARWPAPGAPGSRSTSRRRPPTPSPTWPAPAGVPSSTSTTSARSDRTCCVAHAVHLDDAEVDALLRSGTAVAACPWAYLRLGQGVTGAGRHAELVRRGGRVALGCDSENAGDLVDPLRAAALFAGLAKDTRRRSDLVRRPRRARAADGPRGRGGRPGRGRSARSSPGAGPTSSSTAAARPGSHRGHDPVLQLVWASDGRAVRDVVIDGRVVVRDGRCTTVDVDALRDEAVAAGRRLLARAGIVARPRWPLVRPSDHC